ncbi:MAG: thermonuclease family protein [Candidatus Methanoperedens sp.]|nr:thermonuclease family protein [Candidatus Methanoperedens sp.]
MIQDTIRNYDRSEVLKTPIPSSTPIFTVKPTVTLTATTTPTPIQTATPSLTPAHSATPTVSTPAPTAYAPVDRLANVTSIVDGDTIYVDYQEKVRFVGINTPEIGQVGALEAKSYVADRINGKQIYLDVDNKKPKDKYGRTLAVIYINGENLNKELLCKGYAEVMYIPPSEFDPYSWQASCSDPSTVTPTDEAELKQEISELKERLNQTEKSIKHQEDRISWLEKIVDSLLRWFK